MIKTTIIVPVYKVEKYLAKCLESLINQTLREIEIICINDESPDSCAQILEHYQKIDSRIIVLEQKNSGQGSARNRGLEIARGKYVQFLDSDDSFQPNCCEAMFEVMEREKVNVGCFAINVVYEAFQHMKYCDDSYLTLKYSGLTAIEPKMANKLIDVNCWNKIFRRDFLEKNHIKFPEKLHYEDVAFFWSWITRTDKVYFLNQKLVNYLRRDGSFVSEIWEKKSESILDAFQVQNLIYEDLIKTGAWQSYKKVFLEQYVGKIRWLISSVPSERFDEKREIISTAKAFFSNLKEPLFNLLSKDDIRYIERIFDSDYIFFGAQQEYKVECRIEPAYTNQNSINVVFASDDKYIPYLSVALVSLIKNAAPDRFYDIVILSSAKSYSYLYILHSLVTKIKNISLRFYVVDNLLKKYNVNQLFLRDHLSASAYYRLFVGELFEKYKRIIYLDSDIIVNSDLIGLFDVDLEESAIGAVPDLFLTTPCARVAWKSYGNFRKYCHDKLNIANPDKYFNSGVLIIDIERFNKISGEQKLEMAKSNSQFYLDQNVLNSLYQDYKQLECKWNCQWHVYFNSNWLHGMLPEVKSLYLDFDSVPEIIHYTGTLKPWMAFDASKRFNPIWWGYAKDSPFYPMFLGGLKLGSHVSESLKKSSTKSLKLKLFKYRILSFIMFGDKRRYYKSKKATIKERLKRNLSC